MELLGVRWRRRTDLETSRGESKRRQHRKTEREEGGWSRRQRGEERITPGHTVWEYTNAHFFFFFFFFFIFCPSSVRFLCHVQHLIWRMWRHFPGKEHVSHCLMHTCAFVHSSRIIIKSCGVCVCVCVGDCEGCGCVDWEWGEAGFGFKANEPLMFLQWSVSWKQCVCVHEGKHPCECVQCFLGLKPQRSLHSSERTASLDELSFLGSKVTGEWACD